MEEKIRAEIAKYTTQREQYLVAANREIAYLNGQIASLEALLKPEPVPTPLAEAAQEAA
jgi:hypothetical protein